MKLNVFISKYKDLPITVKASLWFVACSILQKGLALITIPIFTRIMTTDQYGFYNTFVSWYGIILIFSSLSLYYGVFNNGMVRFPFERDSYISSMQGMCTTLLVVLLLLYLTFRECFNKLLGMPTQLVLLLFLKLFFAPSMEFWLARNRFEYKYKKIVIVALSQALLGVIIGICAVLSSNDKAFARILSYVIVDTIFCFIIFIIQQYKGKKIFVKQYWEYAFFFNLPLIPHYLSGVILSQGDRIMISSYCNDTAVAFYSVAYNIGMLINIIINAINASVTPWMYERIKVGQLYEIKKVVNMLCLGMFSIIMLLILFAPEILRVIASQEYADAVYVIPPVAVSTMFIFMYNLFANIEFYYGERKYVSISSVSAAIINILLNAMFIPRFGYYAAAYTTLFCYIIYGLSHLWFTDIILEKNKVENNAFDKMTLLLISFISISIVFVFPIFYSWPLIRYFLIAIIAFMGIVLRNKIFFLLKLIRNR